MPLTRGRSDTVIADSTRPLRRIVSVTSHRIGRLAFTRIFRSDGKGFVSGVSSFDFGLSIAGSPTAGDGEGRSAGLSTAGFFGARRLLGLGPRRVARGRGGQER